MRPGVRSQESGARRVGKEIRPADIDVVILCGGMGSRLKSVVPDRPKPMARIGQRPFLDLLTDRFQQAGFRRFILCVGHMAEQIVSHYRTAHAGIRVVISSESVPLGTAGAVKNAEPSIQSDPFLVTNGDSFCPVDLAAFVAFHQARGGILSMVVTSSTEAWDCGSVAANSSGRITAFQEKTTTHPGGIISAGMYLFSKQVLSLIRPGVKTSLEYDLFPALVSHPCYAFPVAVPVIDIGTPQRLAHAQIALRSPLPTNSQSLKLKT